MADKLSERLERIARGQVWGSGDFKALEAAIELARRVEGAALFTAERVTAAGMTWVGIDVTGHVEYGQRVRLVPEPPEVG